jgi:hypothetical protein
LTAEICFISSVIASPAPRQRKRIKSLVSGISALKPDLELGHARLVLCLDDVPQHNVLVNAGTSFALRLLAGFIRSFAFYSVTEEQ